MKFALRSASSAALLVGMCAAIPAWAQNTGQVEQTPAASAEGPQSVDRVVVTGSYIQGTPEDAALPVEVFTQEDFELRGSPNALEFAKSLTIAGPTSGEAYYFGGPALIGSVNYNLRGIGADKTLTLLNGRRMSPNTSNIPFAAIQRVEILKDGAAVIYGADATGGVVNFITRENFTGLEVNAQYKHIDSSDGDYGISILGGIGSGDVNFLWSAEWEHRSRLKAIDRDFTLDSFTPGTPNFNPAPWSTLTNLAGWLPLGAQPAVPTIGANGAEYGPALAGITSDFTPASCAAVGGRYDNNFTCAYNYSNYYNLVEDNDIYRAFAQLNAAINDNMNIHVEAAYGQVKTPHMYASPSQPIIRGSAMATGATFQFYVPIANPHAQAFRLRSGSPAATQGFTPVTYRVFGHSGNAAFGGQGVPDEIDNQLWRVSAGIDGTLGDWAGFAKDVGYDFALTYNQSINYNTHPDIISSRFQEALMGFGGPACNAPDLDPNRFGTQNPAAAGKNGCQWWNPFATSFAGQPVRNLANPQYVAGTENSLELTRWLFDPRAVEDINSSLTLDLVFNGKSGIMLPGGEIGWALGGQGRQFESREVVNSPYQNGSIPCEWPTSTTSANGAGSSPLAPIPVPTNDPRFRGCTPDSPGPFVTFVPNPPDSADQQQHSLFAEVQLPVLDSVNLQAAVRREEFSGGLGATVYKIAGKWDVFGPLSLRGSYGTNYQTPPVGVIPGEATVGARTYTVAAGNWLGARFITDSSLEPETATAWNVGAIWQSQGFAADHEFRLIVDYFDIETEDQIGQIADPNQIASLVFNGPGGTITTCDPNVQPLVRRITFNGTCTVGMSGVGSFNMVDTLYGNGPGQKTNGYDIQATYALPLGPGDLTLDLTATKITELRTGPTALDGVTISTGDDRLGTLNFATFALAAPEWRANFAVNYAMDRHNFRVTTNYISAVTDERVGRQYGEDGETWLTGDLTYRFQVSDDLALTASVVNMFDRMPPPAQEELGYDPWLANPLGRVIEVGVKKRF